MEVNFKNETSVGDIYIGGVPKRDASSYLLSRVVSYLNEIEINVTYNNQTFPIHEDFIEYDHNLTVTYIKDGIHNDLYADYNDSKLTTELEKILPIGMAAIVDTEMFIYDILNSFENMEPVMNLYIMDYIEDIESLQVPLDSFIYLTDEGDDILSRINDLELIISANSRFSVLDAFSTLDLSTNELNILATGINAITIDTNFISRVKHNSRIMYFEVNNDIENYGTYVHRSQNKDFSFYNPFDLEYRIEIVEHESGMEFILSGIPFEENYDHYVVETVIDFVPLPDDYDPVDGSTHVSGVEGKEIKLYRYILNDNVMTDTELIYTNYYSPKNETYK